MLNRWIGILLAFGMICANGAIVFRDLVPDMLAGDPPPSLAASLEATGERSIQVGIFDDDGRCIGRSWTRARRMGEITQVTSNTLLEPHALPAVIHRRIRIDTELTYRQQDSRVDMLEFAIHGLDMPISLKGENLPSNEFPCVWHVGPETGSFVVNSEFMRTVGDALKPFDRLPELYVGRSWRLKLFDPLAHLSPQFKSEEMAFQSVLVQVIGEEMIDHGDRRFNAFVVETLGARAWVTEDGRVLRQELNLPLLGRLTLLDEPYNEALRDVAVRAVNRFR
jgi:hypothetical protein